jgi:hypothetical protein
MTTRRTSDPFGSQRLPPKQQRNYNFRGIACLPDSCEHAFSGRLFDWRSTPNNGVRFRPSLVGATTMLHLFQFLTRFFEVGAFVAIFFAAAFLLEREGISALAVQIRNLVKRHP